MNKGTEVGLILLSLISSIYGLLGLFGIKVWIRNRGWTTLSLSESLFYLCVGFIMYVLFIFLKDKK